MNPVSLGSLLDRVTKKLGLAPRLRQEMAVHLWPRVAGPEVAAQTVPGPVRDRILIVRTANPVLAHQLKLMEREILQRYRKILGTQCLRGIHLQIGQVSPPAAAKGATSPAMLDLSPERESQLCELAKNVPDPALAKAFLRAAKAWARRSEPPAEERTRAYLELVTGDSWPTAAEIAKALAAIDPEVREAVRTRADETLRRKILARLAEHPRDAESILRVRGDLRRLALVMGYPAGKAARTAAVELLGPEVAAAWPGEE